MAGDPAKPSRTVGRATWVVRHPADIASATGIALTPSDTLLITLDQVPRAVSADFAGNVTLLTGAGFGSDGDGHDATKALHRSMTDIDTDSRKNVLIADPADHRVRSRVQDTSIANTVVQDLDRVAHLACGPDDALFLCTHDHKIVKRAGPTGTETTIVGTGVAGFGGDGGQGTAAKLNHPAGIVVDHNGVVYVADARNHRIRKITKDGIISTVAGTGTFGYTGDDGNATAATLNGPQGVAIDRSGTLYIADTHNGVIRKVDPKGIITTLAFAGLEGVKDDTAAPNTRLPSAPTAIACGHDGALYAVQGDKGVIRIGLPTYAIPHHDRYDIGVEAFTVAAVASFESFETPQPAAQTTPQTTPQPAVQPTADPTPITARGTIIAKPATHRRDRGGWELALAVDPPGQTTGTYLRARLHGRADPADPTTIAPSVELLAPLTSQALRTLHSDAVPSATFSAPTDDVFRKFLHAIALVRDKAGALTLYWNGYPLKPIETKTGTGTLDVSNDEPILVGALHPAPPTDWTGPVVRAAALWRRALDRNEIINQTHLMLTGTIGFPSKVSCTATYATADGAPGKPTTVQLKGSVQMRGMRGTYTAPFDQTRLFTIPDGQLAPTRLAAARKIKPDTKDDGLAGFTFVTTLDPSASVVSVDATLTATGQTAAISIPADPLFPTAMLKDIRRATTQILIADASSKDNAASTTTGYKKVAYAYDDGCQAVTATLNVGDSLDCVGFWRLDEGGTASGLDSSPTNNPVPEPQRTVPKSTGAVLPVFIQDQQRTLWCWAASSTSVEQFYDPVAPVEQQCQLVDRSFRDPAAPTSNLQLGKRMPDGATSCGSDSSWNYGLTPEIGLEGSGNYAGSGSPLSYRACEQQLREGRPLLVTINWAGGGGHTILLTGVYMLKNEAWAVAADPWGHVSSTMKLSTFTTAYPPNGTWTSTFGTRAVWLG